ncbi:hypothetical protein LOAG_08828 [Loa loa]|uniref:Uncharacterized protein n=1 Tax=Loa loa TaxID=7209 RepID=A0A1S0TTI7_LOALO|nr:hypothetical protein LOAG_08828 [Loa loa]EFO19662.1 hypothetical protein LOAG_08828 [Loa loa]
MLHRPRCRVVITLEEGTTEGEFIPSSPFAFKGFFGDTAVHKRYALVPLSIGAKHYFCDEQNIIDVQIKSQAKKSCVEPYTSTTCVDHYRCCRSNGDWTTLLPMVKMSVQDDDTVPAVSS